MTQLFHVIEFDEMQFFKKHRHRSSPFLLSLINILRCNLRSKDKEAFVGIEMSKVLILLCFSFIAADSYSSSQ